MFACFVISILPAIAIGLLFGGGLLAIAISLAVTMSAVGIVGDRYGWWT